MLVGRDAGESLEHFVAFECESLFGPAVGEKSACDGMGVQDGSCAELLDDDQVQVGLRGRATRPAEDSSIGVDFENVRRGERALVEAARCDGKTKGRPERRALKLPLVPKTHPRR